MLGEFVLRATAVLALAWTLAAGMRHASAASRHLTWMTACGIVLLLPVASVALPPLRLPILAPVGAPIGNPGDGVPGGLTRPFVPSRAIPPSPTRPSSLKSPKPNSLNPAEPVLLVAWLAGTLGLLQRILYGAIAARRRGQEGALVVDTRILERLEHAQHLLGVRRPIRIWLDAENRMPVTWGILHPTLLLPASALDWHRSDRDPLDAVLIHEVAHIARVDRLWQLASDLTRGLLWFHPLAWIGTRRARLEQERACDDLVLRAGVRPSDYADALLALAETLQPATASADGSLAMARSSHLEARVDNILRVGVNRRSLSRGHVAIAAAIAIVAVPLVTVRAVPIEPAATPRYAGAPVVDVVQVGRGPRPASPVPASNTPMVTSPSGSRNAFKREDQSAHPPTTPQVAASVDATAQPDPSPLLTEQGPTIASQAIDPAAAGWRVERAAMLQQLIEHAAQDLEDARIQVRFGLMAMLDASGLERTLEDLQRTAAERGAAEPPPAPLPVTVTLVRRRFADAMGDLRVEETKFTIGLSNVDRLSVALRAAGDVLNETGTASEESTSTADAALLTALQQAAAIPSDVDRANALLALAKDNALTPDMVAVFVAAASAIRSDDERARVFAQPIRVKAGG